MNSFGGRGKKSSVRLFAPFPSFHHSSTAKNALLNYRAEFLQWDNVFSGHINISHTIFSSSNELAPQTLYGSELKFMFLRVTDCRTLELGWVLEWSPLLKQREEVNLQFSGSCVPEIQLSSCLLLRLVVQTFLQISFCWKLVKAAIPLFAINSPNLIQIPWSYFFLTFVEAVSCDIIQTCTGQFALVDTKIQWENLDCKAIISMQKTQLTMFLFDQWFHKSFCGRCHPN